MPHSGPYEPDPHGIPATGGLPMDYARELFETRRVLDEVPVVGDPHRGWELDELRRLIGKYPSDARKILDAEQDAKDPQDAARPEP
jgi:hypothetical protein